MRFHLDTCTIIYYVITARNMNTLKEEMCLFLCLNISKYCSFYCEVCGNSNSSNAMINDNEGIEVCLGGDRKGCANVLYMNCFTQPYIST